MQWAVTAAIGSALGGAQATFASLYYQTIYDREDETARREFPYDLKRFLSSAELDGLIMASKKYQTELWPQERIEAAKGKAILAKRAAHSPFLWAKYSEQPGMSLETLRLWFQVEQIEKVLNAPDWFMQQHPNAPDIQQQWQQYLGDRRQDLEARHRQVLERLVSFAV